MVCFDMCIWFTFVVLISEREKQFFILLINYSEGDKTKNKHYNLSRTFFPANPNRPFPQTDKFLLISIGYLGFSLLKAFLEF